MATGLDPAFLEAAFLDRFEERFSADPAGFQVLRAADEGNTPMAEVEQVLYCLRDTASIVDSDVADVAGHLPHVEENHGDRAARKLLSQRWIHLRSHDRDGIHFPLEHAAHARSHPGRIIFGIGQKDFVAVLRGSVLKPFHQLWEERVSNVGNNQAHYSAASRNERAGLSIGEIL